MSELPSRQVVSSSGLVQPGGSARGQVVAIGGVRCDRVSPSRGELVRWADEVRQ